MPGCNLWTTGAAARLWCWHLGGRNNSSGLIWQYLATPNFPNSFFPISLILLRVLQLLLASISTNISPLTTSQQCPKFQMAKIIMSIKIKANMHCSPKGPYRDLIDCLGPYLFFKVPIFKVLAKFTWRMSIQSAITQQWVNLIWAVLNHNLLLERVSTFAGTGSVLHCWWILVVTSAYSLNFTNHCFGSLFWLPRVPIGSLFQEKWGPYLSMEDSAL